MAWTVLTHGGLPRRFLRPFSARASVSRARVRSEEHTSELQTRENLVCRLPLEKRKSWLRAAAVIALTAFLALFDARMLPPATQARGGAPLRVMTVTHLFSILLFFLMIRRPP